MKKYAAFLFTIVILTVSATPYTLKPAETLAKKTLKAHGGKYYKEMKSLAVRGNVDITVSSFNQAFPATFATIISGEKYMLEIDNPFQPFKQVFDGETTSSSIDRGFTLPPITSIGMPLLQKIGDKGYEISALVDKKKRGFRITTPDGYYTDFFTLKKTNLVKAYEASYTINGTEALTTVEIDKFVEKAKVIVPQKFAQRFDIGQMTVYAEFKAKEVLVNTDIDDEVFTLN